MYLYAIKLETMEKGRKYHAHRKEISKSVAFYILSSPILWISLW